MVYFQSYQGKLLPECLKRQIIQYNLTFPWTKDQTLLDFDNQFSEYYVALETDNSNRLLAYIALHRIFEEATINLVYVDESQRRKGLASQLLHFVEESLASKKVDQVLLEVRASNQAALGLYKQLAYEQLTERKNYYQNPNEDALILIKNIRKDVTK